MTEEEARDLCPEARPIRRPIPKQTGDAFEDAFQAFLTCSEYAGTRAAFRVTLGFACDDLQNVIEALHDETAQERAFEHGAGGGFRMSKHAPPCCREDEDEDGAYEIMRACADLVRRSAGEDRKLYLRAMEAAALALIQAPKTAHGEAGATA